MTFSRLSLGVCQLMRQRVPEPVTAGIYILYAQPDGLSNRRPVSTCPSSQQYGRDEEKTAGIRNLFG